MVKKKSNIATHFLRNDLLWSKLYIVVFGTVRFFSENIVLQETYMIFCGGISGKHQFPDNVYIIMTEGYVQTFWECSWDQ